MSKDAEYRAAKAIAEKYNRKLGKGWEQYEAEQQIMVDYDCWEAWELFQDASGQWRFDGSGKMIDLDATATVSLIGLVTDDKEKQRQLWRELRTIVSGVKQVVNEMNS